MWRLVLNSVPMHRDCSAFGLTNSRCALGCFVASLLAMSNGEVLRVQRLDARLTASLQVHAPF